MIVMALKHSVCPWRTIDIRDPERPLTADLTSAVGDERSDVLRARLHHATRHLMYSLEAVLLMLP